jgi:protease-4
VKLAAQVKPVIASMGDVAASGGYYVLAQADKIIASPNPITGSIGVFGIIPNAKEFFNDKLGISVDIVKTNKHSDYNTIFRPLDPKERSIIKHNIERVYDRFTQAVANGRGVTQEYVDSVGQGRVWSGTNALELNLIDEYGGLNDAVEMAVEMAEVEKYRIVELPELEDPIEQIIKKLTGEAQTWMLKKELGESYKYYKSAQKFIHMNGVQAIMPMEIELY